MSASSNVDQRQPYIGITGFMHPSEIEAIQSLFDPGGPRHLMVGILVSAKTWRGQPTRHVKLYPEVSRLQELFAAVDPTRAFGLVHYNAFGPPDSNGYPTSTDWLKDENRLFYDCRDILYAAHDWEPEVRAKFGGFQYNLPLPARPSLYWLENRRSSLCGERGHSVLQLWPQQLELIKPFLKEKRSLAEELDYRYSSHRQRVTSWPFETLLYDVSGGYGVPITPAEALELIEPLIPLTYHKTNLQLAVAGGMCAETVPLFQPVVERYPQLSIDAQGRLRDGNGDLDLDAAKRYVEAALLLLSS